MTDSASVETRVHRHRRVAGELTCRNLPTKVNNNILGRLFYRCYDAEMQFTSTILASTVDAHARSPRGRPSKEQAEAIDRHVLDSARSCFLAAGFDGATMGAIAKHAGVTKMTLYLRYPDKVTLLKAVIEDRTSTWSDISDQRVVNRGDTLDQRLRHYARSLLRWSRVAEVQAFGKLIHGCWGSAQAVADEMQAIRTGRMRDLLTHDIATLGVIEGLDPRDPRQLADIFLGMLTAFSAPSALAEEEAAPLIAAFADRIVDILMSGQSAWK